MITIELRFAANRFHANPWGRHVNEGVAEWPPSPYRLLRGLCDAWRRKRAHLAEERVHSLLRALASVPPRFALPPATASHTRTYLSRNTEDPTDKSLVFDAFLALDPGSACYIEWPGVDLAEADRGALAELLEALNYLGRSESWVAARLVDGPPRPADCVPAEQAGAGGDLVRVACAVPETQYAGKRPWLEALCYSTADLIKDRRSSPPAMRMVGYLIPRGSVRCYVPALRRPAQTGPSAVLLALDSTVLPLITATVEVAEQIRLRLMGIHRRLMSGDPTLVSPVFSGKTREGRPLSGHRHLFILPLATDAGRINRVLLLSPGRCLDPTELAAILELRRLWQTHGRPEVRCVAVWQGSAADASIRPPASTVRSRTPFVTIRHWRKGRGSPEDFLAAEVARECRNHGLPEPLRIWPAHPPGPFEWVEFRRNRKGDPPRPGFGFQIEFPEPVPAPLALGYGCHFGLGQFDRD